MLFAAIAHDHGVSHADVAVGGRPPQDSTVEKSILVAGPLRVIKPKEHLFREGDAVSHVYEVEAGHICTYKIVPDGRRQVIDFAYPGDVVGLGTLGKHGTSAQAMTVTRVRCMPLANLREVMSSDARLGIEFYEAVSRELQSARELLFTVSKRNAVERVAAFLLGLSRRKARNGEDPLEFVLPMTRNDIADFLGLSIETVSRTFTKLRTEGLIELSQSVLVTITDIRALGGLAETRMEAKRCGSLANVHQCMRRCRE